MDGAGGLLRPLTAGATGGADAWAAPLPDFSLSSLPLFRFLARARLFRSRRSVAAPAVAGIPRFLGTGLALGFLGTVTVVGLSAGGELQALRNRYGEPHHLGARALG